ncbi:hypothetical protein SFRURICE_010736 [Spodoptera frugiperda]|nr:hypothetical protein SFRURICE_010736 [Spodoptera frugiperda]
MPGQVLDAPPEAVHVVDTAAEPVQVVEVAPPIPPIAVNPIGFVPPAQVEPVIIGMPPVGSELAELQEIIAAINSPSTDPATAAALEEMLLDALGVKPEPVEVGPAVIDTHPISVGPAIIESNPISVGPALIDFPLPDAGVVAEEPIVPTPVIVAPAPVDEVTPVAAAAPLVQIILNINQAAADVSPVAVGPAVEPTPVHVVESAPEPVHVVEVAPEPVQVVETAPVPVEPVVIGVPILPEAVMKFFAAIVLVAAVASATPVDRRRPSAILDHIAGIIAAVKPESVAVGPAIIENPEPVAVGPAWVDAPEPVAVGPGSVSSEIATGTPLVQIILNINHASAAASPVAVGQVLDAPPEAVHVVDTAAEPVQVVEVAPPIPPIAVNPIGVVPPAQVEPVIIGMPVIPLP